MYLLELNLRLVEDKWCLNIWLGFCRFLCRFLDLYRLWCLKSVWKVINFFKFLKFIKLWRRLLSFILLIWEWFNKMFLKCFIFKICVNFVCGCFVEFNLYYLEIIFCWLCLEEWWWIWVIIWCMMWRWLCFWYE